MDPATGDFECASPSFDCASTRFDSCLVGRHCWPNCAGDDARRLTQFLKCYEGPYANTENLTDPTRREPCMQEAGFEDYEDLLACSQNQTAGSELDRMQRAINATRGPMYAALKPNPGLFPHIFLNGSHQWNNSWTHLLSTLCDDEWLSAPPACKRSEETFSFQLQQHGPLTVAAIKAHPWKFQAAVQLAVNYAVSQVAFPVHFRTAGEPGGAPSYVNVKAVRSVEVSKLAPSGVGHWLRVDIKLQGVLAEYEEALRDGCASPEVAEYLAWALSSESNTAGVFGNVTASDIQKPHIV